MPEVLIYGRIDSELAVNFIKEINEGEGGEDLTARINTPGGDVMYTYGMITKYREFEGKKVCKVDGQAYSGGAFFSLFSDEVEAHDFARFLFHRAAYPSWYEPDMPEAIRNELIEINKDLERAFRAKLDVKKFEEISGVKVKDLFSMDDRIDVFLNAKQAKEIGLVTKLTKLTPTKKAELNAEFVRIAAHHTDVPLIEETIEEEQKPEENKDKSQINTKMTPEEFKSKHPEAFAKMSSDVTSAAVEAERDRVGAWMAFNKVDPEAVKAGIESGKAISQTQMSEFSIKLASGAKLAELETEEKDKPGADAAAAIPPASTDKPDAATSFEATVMASLNIKKD